MEARAAELGHLMANDTIQFAVATMREQGVFKPDKLYCMTVEEVDNEERIRGLMHIVACTSILLM